jgi:hypothetical protein
MAVLLQITYQKKLGLPNFSSHSCSVSVQVEVADLSQVAEENNRLYKLLQASVDEEIQKVGFMPDATSYGMNGGLPNGNGPHRQQRRTSEVPDSPITEKQLDLINSILRDNNANKAEMDNLCVEMFGGGIRTLNRIQASEFIDELFIKFPRRKGNGTGRYQRQPVRT